MSLPGLYFFNLKTKKKRSREDGRVVIASGATQCRLPSSFLFPRLFNGKLPTRESEPIETGTKEMKERRREVAREGLKKRGVLW